jgi:cholesterol transport system auxiliary component
MRRGRHAARVRASLRAAIAAGIIAGAAGCGSIVPGADRPPPRLYDLSPKSTFPPNLPKAHWQLIVEPPIAAAGLSSARIAIKREDYRLEYFARAAWTDTAPKMVQTLIVESFENSGDIVSVGRESAGLRSDYVLKTELREFQAEYHDDKKPRVRVRINAKIVEMPQRTIIASKTIERLATVKTSSMDGIVTAFDDALGKTLKHLVEWTLRAGDKSWTARRGRRNGRYGGVLPGLPRRRSQ